MQRRIVGSNLLGEALDVLTPDERLDRVTERVGPRRWSGWSVVTEVTMS